MQAHDHGQALRSSVYSYLPFYSLFGCKINAFCELFIKLCHFFCKKNYFCASKGQLDAKTCPRQNSLDIVKYLYDKYDKKAIAELPKVQFEGRIIVIQSVGEARRAVDYLLTFPRLGIDTETRPNFKPGAMNPVALLQVSTPDTCFLFRLNRMGLPECVVRLLTDAHTQKIGLSLHDDWTQLRRRVDFEPVNYVEIQEQVKRLGILDQSLQKLYANLFRQKISKTQRLSNWEADVLTEPQKRYAATDAWACLNLFKEINRLLTTKDYQLITTEQESL